MLSTFGEFVQQFELPMYLTAPPPCVETERFASEFKDFSIGSCRAQLSMCERSSRSRLRQSTVERTPLRFELSLVAMVEHARAFPGMNPRTYLSQRGNGGESPTRITSKVHRARNSSIFRQHARRVLRVQPIVIQQLPQLALSR